MSLRLYPVTVREANEFIGENHRHSDPVIQSRFCIGVAKDGQLVGESEGGLSDER